MKKLLAAALALLIAASLAPAVFAEEEPDGNSTARWTQNSPLIDIYDEGSVDENAAAVQMLSDKNVWVTTDTIPPYEPIRLLMINGGFVPAAKIIVANNRTLVPARLVSETLGAKVGWDEKNRVVTITADILGEETEIVLTIDSAEAKIDGETVILDAPPKIYSNSTYVPMRFIAEALGAKVDFTASGSDLFGPKYPGVKYEVSVVVIEKTDMVPTFTPEDGLKAVKAESEKMYKQVKDYLAETNRTFSEYDPDYDPLAVTHIGNFGRYYVYILKGFEELTIMYNMYTGEIFSQHAGLPFIQIEKGFINISWLYQ